MNYDFKYSMYHCINFNLIPLKRERDLTFLFIKKFTYIQVLLAVDFPPRSGFPTSFFLTRQPMSGKDIGKDAYVLSFLD